MLDSGDSEMIKMTHSYLCPVYNMMSGRCFRPYKITQETHTHYIDLGEQGRDIWEGSEGNNAEDKLSFLDTQAR